MTLDLDDRVYLVLGSSRGIGLVIAQALLGEGGRVVLTGRDPATLEATARALLDEHPDRVISCAGDLGQPATLATVEDATHQRWGRLDGIVANIGGVRPVPEWKIDEADWDWFFEANLWASVRAVTHFIPHLISSRGAIVFIGSIAGASVRLGQSGLDDVREGSGAPARAVGNTGKYHRAWKRVVPRRKLGPTASGRSRGCAADD